MTCKPHLELLVLLEHLHHFVVHVGEVAHDEPRRRLGAHLDELWDAHERGVLERLDVGLRHLVGAGGRALEEAYEVLRSKFKNAKRSSPSM